VDPIRFYEQARKEFAANRPEAAADTLDLAAKGVLRIPTGAADSSKAFKVYGLLREMATRTREQAGMQATRKNRKQALRLCDQIREIGTQLADSEDANLVTGLVAVAILRMSSQSRGSVLQLLGDKAAAKTEADNLKGRQSLYDRTVQPRVDALATQKVKATPKDEKQLVKDMTAIWR
jgi:hypothetical protein